jgi:hypothetical protein
MARAYSLDLRERVVAAVPSGQSRRAVARRSWSRWAQASHRFNSLRRVWRSAPRFPQVPGAAATPDRIFRPQHCVSSAP